MSESLQLFCCEYLVFDTNDNFERYQVTFTYCRGLTVNQYTNKQKVRTELYFL